MDLCVASACSLSSSPSLSLFVCVSLLLSVACVLEQERQSGGRSLSLSPLSFFPCSPTSSFLKSPFLAPNPFCILLYFTSSLSWLFSQSKTSMKPLKSPSLSTLPRNRAAKVAWSSEVQLRWSLFFLLVTTVNVCQTLICFGYWYAIRFADTSHNSVVQTYPS